MDAAKKAEIEKRKENIRKDISLGRLGPEKAPQVNQKTLFWDPSCARKPYSGTPFAPENPILGPQLRQNSQF